MRAQIAITVLLLAACGGGGDATDEEGSETTTVTLAPPDSTTSSAVVGETTTVGPTTTAGSATSNSDTTEDTEAQTVTPVISFEPRTLTFTRGLRVPLWATSEPDTTLVYTVVPSEDDAFAERCRVDGTDFVFETEPGPASAPARCTIEAASAQGDAASVTAVVTIDRASWEVDIAPIDDVSYAAVEGVLAVTVFEDTGSAYEFFYTVNCTREGGSGYTEGYAEPRPVPPATEHTFDLPLPWEEFGALLAESNTQLDCSLTVEAGPLDLGTSDVSQESFGLSP